MSLWILVSNGAPIHGLLDPLKPENSVLGFTTREKAEEFLLFAQDEFFGFPLDTVPELFTAAQVSAIPPEFELEVDIERPAAKGRTS